MFCCCCRSLLAWNTVHVVCHVVSYIYVYICMILRLVLRGWDWLTTAIVFLSAREVLRAGEEHGCDGHSLQHTHSL